LSIAGARRGRLAKRGWSMPEEINRVLTDILSDLLFITEESVIGNLRRESILKERIYFVWITIVDTLLKHRKKAKESTILQRLGIQGHGKDRDRLKHALVTLHPTRNVGNWEIFEEILHVLTAVSKEQPVIFSVHRRTIARI
jgi:UDP-N-acetylglucosamine 2-epimerase (non-hydrolysing)